jgi:hypothetical protein
MKLFGQLVRTVVNTALVPVAVVADVVTLGGVVGGGNDPLEGAGEFQIGQTHTGRRLQTLKDEAREDED